MAVILKNIKAKNFLTWSTLYLDLENQGLLGILGDNYSGKSNIFSAIMMALYGRTLRGHLKTSVVKDGETSWYVESEFSCNGQDYKVVRGGKSHALFMGGALLVDTFSGVNEKMSQLIKCSFNEFINISYIGQNRSGSLVSVSDGDRKNLIEPLLGLPDFRKLKNQVFVKFTKAEKDFAVLSEKESLLTSQLDTKVKGDKAELAVLSRTKDLKIKELNSLRSRYHKIRTKISSVGSSEDTLREECNVVKTSILDIDLKLQDFKDFIAGSCGSLGSRCPTCLTVATETSKSTVVAYIKKSVSLLQAKLLVLGRELSSLTSDRIKVTEELRKLAKDKQSLNNVLVKITTELKGVNSRVRAIKLSLTKTDFSSVLKAVVKGKDLCADDIKYYSFWNSALGGRGLSAYILRGVIPRLSDRVSYYLNDLLSGARVSFYYNDKSQTIQADVFFGGIVRGYFACSGAERRLIDLSCSMALYDLGCERYGEQSNVILMDEIFDSLDLVHMESVRGWLNKLNHTTILVISHHEIIKDWLPNVRKVKFEKSVGSFFI